MTITRDVQLSAFPDIQAAKPVGGIVGSVFTGTNAELMRAIAPMYLTGTVVDTTYGKGRWWTKHTPPGLVGHDLDPDKGDGVSFFELPETTGSVNTTTFDPPYVPAGGESTNADVRVFRHGFGLKPRNRAELLELIYGGMAECCRISTDYVLAKCSDYVDWHAFHLGHLDMIDAARQCGWVVHDFIIHATGSGPGGHNIYEVQRARRAHSYLVVFVPDPKAGP